jgi:hypothetical protein
MFTGPLHSNGCPLLRARVLRERIYRSLAVGIHVTIYRIEVLAEVCMKGHIFWDINSYSSFEIKRRFRGHIAFILKVD